MANAVPLTPRISSVKRFYFLEYFYVLLKSIEKYADREQIFESFKVLKQKHRLGESKYRIRFDIEDASEELSEHQISRFRYTFDEVIDEAREYDLITEQQGTLHLTPRGAELLGLYEGGDVRRFNVFLFECMEKEYQEPFRYLVKLLYESSTKKPGLLIFPTYSPRQLGFRREEITRSADIMNYASVLVDRLERDIDEHLGMQRNLDEHNRELLARLQSSPSRLLPTAPSEQFDPRAYNKIIKRFRDHWIGYFLNKIYGYEQSLSSFERWTYRGKQIGIVYATDFYPSFEGRIVYPTSVVLGSAQSRDFRRLYEYRDGMGLFVHQPDWESISDEFVKELVNGYFTLRRSNRNYFVNLSSLRELVCYSLKISEYLFEEFLERAYRLNLSRKLPIGISLEVDKLPEETTAMYLKREPVLVDGRYRNIIAIDVAKRS